MGNIEGLDGLRVKMLGLREDLLHRAGGALYEEALEMSAVSQERTPVMTGALRASHTVSEPEYDGDRSVKVVISVGGPSIPYAYRVHENIEANHEAPHRGPDGQMYTCGGEAKFLESAVREGSEGLGGRLAERMK